MTRLTRLATVSLLLATLALVGAVDVFGQDQSKVYAIWGNPNNGRKVYAEKGCGRCHAINGVGPSIGPDLGRPPARPQTITQLAGAMWNHAPEMRKLAQEKGVQWAGFKEAELRDLIAYLYFLRMLDQPGDVRRGERLFDDKHCSACHALAGPRWAPRVGFEPVEAVRLADPMGRDHVASCGANGSQDARARVDLAAIPGQRDGGSHRLHPVANGCAVGRRM